MIDRTGRQLDKYRLLRLLGRGGFADVYLAEHFYLQAPVAVKILHTQLDQKTIESFLKEAQTIAKLRNPHIVRVQDFGIDNTDNTLYLVMDYAPHGSLRTLYPHGSVVPLEKVVSYVQQVADALQHAHDAKIIHRDVKPENMLLGHNGEVILSDFGLAAAAHSAASLKTMGNAGTIDYMPKEQINGKPQPASDQYALAITVYEWLCGTRPFTGAWTEIAIQHAMTPPPLLRDKVLSIKPEVERVVLKGLAKDLTQRYASVREFAEALEEVSKPKQLQIMNYFPIGTRFINYTGHSALVRAVAWSPDGSLLASASAGNAQIWHADSGKLFYAYKVHSTQVRSVAWSPDGARLAFASSDDTVKVWHVETGRLLRTYTEHSGTGHFGGLWGVAWSPDSTRLASASSDGAVQIWRADTGQLLRTYTGHSGWVRAIAWSPGGRDIASASDDKTVQIWHVDTGQLLHTYEGHSNYVNIIAWSPDGTRIASSSNDKTVRVCRADIKQLLRIYTGHSDRVWGVTWSPDGTRIVSGSTDKTVQIWEPNSGKLLYAYTGHSDAVYGVAWSPDGTRVASASQDKTCRCGRRCERGRRMRQVLYL